MTPGSIILIRFPFAEGNMAKLRPALVAALTADKYQDVIVCAISSVLHPNSGNSPFEIILQPNQLNGLKVPSVLKVDRIVTLKAQDIVRVLGSLSDTEWSGFCRSFQLLVA